MRNLKLFLTIFAISWFATGCVSSQKIDKAQVNDRSLSCQELLVKIEEAESFKEKAEENKRVNGGTVLAALFFPALISTYMDANDAIKAAEDRKAHLVQIYSEKKCATKTKK